MLVGLIQPQLLLLLLVLSSSLAAAGLLSWGSNSKFQAGSNRFATYIETPQSPILPSSIITRVVVGYQFVVAEKLVVQDGVPSYSLIAIGNNEKRQLGNMQLDQNAIDNAEEWVEVDVPSQSFPFQAIIAGYEYVVVAVGNKTELYSWGENSLGQLGRATQTGHEPNPSPVDSSNILVNDNLPIILQVAAGVHHTVAVTQGGYLISWGKNAERQLGYETNGDPGLSPRYIPNASPDSTPPVGFFVQVACGVSHSLAMTDDGNVYAWGSNTFGESFYSSNQEDPISIPHLVGNDILKQVSSSFYGAISIAAGDRFSVAIRGKLSGPDAVDESSVGLLFWGLNNKGQCLGLQPDTQSTFTLETGSQCDKSIKDIDNVFAGHTHLISIQNGAMVEWGEFTQPLGNTPTPNCEVVRSYSPRWISQVATGKSITAVLLNDGSIDVMGIREQLPNGVPNPFNSTMLALDFVEFSAGFEHTIALTNDGRVMGWGSNSKCQSSPAGVQSEYIKFASFIQGLPSTVLHIAANYHTSYASTAEYVYKWGFDTINDPSICSPTAILDIATLEDNSYSPLASPTILQLSAGYDHLAILVESGSTRYVYEHGNSAPGYVSGVRLMDIQNNPKIVKVSAGKGHTLALEEGGWVWAWGTEYFSDVPQYLFPFSPGNPDAVRNIAAKYLHMAFVTTNNQLYLFGRSDDNGELNGLTADSHPTLLDLTAQLSINADVLSVYDAQVTEKNTIVITDKGTVLAWGDNSFNQITHNGQIVVQPSFITMTDNQPVFKVEGGSGFFVAQTAANVQCNGVNATDPSVCSGHGFCSIVDHSCKCHVTHHGNNCQYPTCQLIADNSPTVCSGRGTCVDVDICVCKPVVVASTSYGNVYLMSEGHSCQTPTGKYAGLASTITGNITLTNYTLDGTVRTTYRISNDTVVESGATLTISPGITIQFEEGARLIVRGRLIAVGQAANPVNFTAVTPGHLWRSIRLEEPISAEIRHAVFSNGGFNSRATIESINSIASLKDIKFLSSATAGIFNCGALLTSSNNISGSTTNSLMIIQSDCY